MKRQLAEEQLSMDVLLWRAIESRAKYQVGDKVRLTYHNWAGFAEVEGVVRSVDGIHHRDNAPTYGIYIGDIPNLKVWSVSMVGVPEAKLEPAG